jgi:hypothetical protein
MKRSETLIALHPIPASEAERSADCEKEGA